MSGAAAAQEAMEEAPFGLEFGPSVLEAPEYHWTSFLGSLVKYRDDDGRPLGEGTAPRKYWQGVPMEMKTCPYSGSRHKHPLPMNVSALRQVTQHWRAVAGGMIHLRDEYVKHRGAGRAREPLSLTDVWKVSRLGLMVPAYLLRRANNPVADGRIPAMTAVIYKIMLGLNRVADAQTLMAFAAGFYDDLPPMDPATISAFTETNELFIGRHSVCAGPPAMAEETFRIVLHGQSTGEYDTAPMARLLEPGALEYFNLLMAMDLEKYDFGLRSTIQSHDLARRLAELPQDDEATRALSEAARAFDARTAETSSLARELAAADAESRPRVVAGLRRFRDELEEERVSLCGRGLAPLYATTDARRTPAPEQVTALEGFLGAFRPPSPGTRVFAEVLAEYLALERSAMAVFEGVQHRLDEALGHPPVPLRLGNGDVLKIFGPKLRDFAAELLGLDIQNSAHETLLRKDGHELHLRA